MADIWFCSDHHFNHARILTFTDKANNLIRPQFRDIHHMNEHLIEAHNARVKPKDKVYFLGDLGRGSGDCVRRMNGKKRLILGNHDDLLTKDELMHFKWARSWRAFKTNSLAFVCTHFPMAPISFQYRGSKDGNGFNVHGHLHEKHVVRSNVAIRDLRYLNICVEQTNYAPIHMDEVTDILKTRISKGITKCGG